MSAYSERRRIDKEVSSTSYGSDQAVVEPRQASHVIEVPINSNSNSLQLIIHRAALRGDWKAAKNAMRLAESEDILKKKITLEGDTLLHIAAAAKQTAFVHKLVNKLSREDLALTNKSEDTPFCIAAVSGVVEIANVMYEKNETLPTIKGCSGASPIEQAAVFGNKEMVDYLKEKSFQYFDAETRMSILVAIIRKGMYDIALKILKEDELLIVNSPKGKIENALNALARSSLSLQHVTCQDSQEWICGRLSRIFPCVPCFKRIYDSIQMRGQANKLVKKLCKQISALEYSEIVNLFQKTTVLQYAAKTGNVEFLTLLLNSYPDLIWTVDKDFYTIFHLAVINRQERVFCLIYSIGALQNYLCDRDRFGNNILHLAAKLAPSSRLNSVSGAALQMHRELFWFRVVEKMKLDFGHDKNFKGETPRELFTKEHEKLREAGERWMKDTATSCMVVAALIATVAFAAAITVPGGNKEETGRPIFLNDRWFTVFVMSDAMAMFSSTTSIMMFLSILTSRYGEEDFLFTLPAKLTIGIITLFASIVCMVLTFSATFFLVYKEEKENQGTIPKIVAGLALLQITLYAVLNCRLWISLIRSTIWAFRFMFQPSKQRLFYQNELR